MAKKVHKTIIARNSAVPRVMAARGGYRKSTMPIPDDFDNVVRKMLLAPKPAKKKKARKTR